MLDERLAFLRTVAAIGGRPHLAGQRLAKAQREAAKLRKARDVFGGAVCEGFSHKLKRALCIRGPFTVSSEDREHWFLMAAGVVVVLFLLLAVWIWIT
jgi:hypothetical protein